MLLIIILILIILLTIFYFIYITYFNLEIIYFNTGNNCFLKEYDNFLSKEECEYIINNFKDKCNKSLFLADNGDIQNDNDVRNSYDYGFKKNSNDLITKIEDKISKILNISKDNFEEIQLIKYKKGNFYKNHFDYLDVDNDRIYTVIIYLNTLNEEDGGYTIFPLFNQQIKPIQGKAISFKNVINNKCFPKSMHKGEIIKTDKEKYILSCWIRKYKAN